jgi:hypothetical protein
MFKVMHVSDVSQLDDLFPQASLQTPQLPKYGTVSDRILQSGASVWRPALGHGAGRIEIRMKG